MDKVVTNAQKTRALPWALAGDALCVIHVYLAFAGPIFLLFLDSLGMDKARIGIVLATVPLCDIIVLLVAPMAARVGFKRIFLTGWALRKFILVLLVAAPWVAAEFGKDAVFYFVATVVLGFSLVRSTALAGLGPWIQEYVPVTIRGRFSALQNVVAVLVGAGTVAVVGAVLGKEPKVSQFIMLFAVGFVLGLLGVLCYARVPGGGSITGDRSQRADFRSSLTALKDRRFLVFLCGGALVTLGWGPMVAFLPLFLRDQVGLTDDYVMYFTSVQLGAGLISCLMWGWAADRYGSKPVMVLTLAMLLIYPIGMLLLPRNAGDTSFYAACAVAAVVGIALPGWSIGYSRCLYVNLIPNDQRAGYNAMHFAWAGLMSGVSPLIAGAVLDYTSARPDIFTGQIMGITIDSFTPLMVSAVVLLAASVVVMSQLRSEGEVAVTRFAGMFMQGNPFAAMQSLIAYQRGGREAKRINTIEMLGDARSPLNIEELIEALSDPGFNVRHEAIISIARTRQDPRLTDALIEVLREAEPDMRTTAAWALGRVGDPRGIEPLREALESEYPLLRARAARALATLGDDAQRQQWIDALTSEEDTGLRLAYAASLGAISAVDALPAMLQLLASLEANMQRVEVAAAIAGVIGKEDWFVLLMRRTRKDPGDSLGGVLLALRKRVMRVATDRDAMSRAMDDAVMAFGGNDFEAGGKQFVELLNLMDRSRLSDAVNLVLDDVAQRITETGGQRHEYPALGLHALHAGLT